MLRMLICSLMLSACVTVSRPVPTNLAGCVDLGPIVYDRMNEVVSATETFGPSQVIWLHPPTTIRGYFTEAAGHLYSCRTPLLPG